MTHKIRTKMRPDLEIEVGDAEYLDLTRQGAVLLEPEFSDRPAPKVRRDAAEKAAEQGGEG